MARSTLRRNPKEYGDVNPLDDDSLDDAGSDTVILKVEITTSSPTLSLSNPDDNFRLILSVRVFASPRASAPITIATGRTALDVDSYIRGAFRLECITDPSKSIALSTTTQPHYARTETANKDLEEIEWLKFVTVPPKNAGVLLIEHPLPLERMLSREPTVKCEDLTPGLKYRVWTDERILNDVATSYWGGLDGELKDKKLSDKREDETLQLDREALEADNWVLDQGGVIVRGNVGKHGPVFELVE
ncbi:hypothetical protein CCMSSC00406_0002166 [Pleurotus cornucopiae]|uniref:Uncharacterized protein n=1 Tax=Pleurotus cornucopiae TaxID=5321 RepID=A0ACB7J5P4_PLECO|nr:hypothetical protein CCMSSC00406_0002166 [Pleurotus cornucopiae]